MIRLMGGDIKLESTLGEGTTVTFTIPFLTKVNQSTSKKPLGTSSFAKKKVLIVEDNPINQKLMTRLLQQFGYETKSALNGSLAVHQLSEESFNLVLMDIQMPEMNGYEATILIRDQNSPVLDHNIPIVAVTAHAMKDDLDKCLASGMNDYLTKPIDKVKLKAALEQWSLSLPNPTEPNSTELK
jgi:CheY-like chemotaxis protein